MPAAAENPVETMPDLRSRFAGGVRLVADDLTGACDAAIAFVGQMDVRVWLGAEAGCAAPELVQAFVTDSREMSEREAAAVTRRAFVAFAERRDVLAFKKIDSVMRGAVVAEVIAAHEALGTRAVVMTPSFPAAGRTVVDGVLDVRGGDEIELRALFAEEMRERVAVVRAAGEMDAALAAGKTVLLCDAMVQEELEAIAASAREDGLLAGSAGLAYALACVAPGDIVGSEMPRVGRVLTVCGTNHAVTERQMAELQRQMQSAAVLRIRAEAEDAAAIVAAFERVRPSALVLTGGDTALLVLRTLGADSIVLKGEFAAGVPWGVVQGGAPHGCVVVTKSGGFGAVDTLVRAVAALGGSDE